MNEKKERRKSENTPKDSKCTHAIFSDGERHGSSSSSSLSSLTSSSMPSSPETLNEDEVNMSGTGRIDGLRLPVDRINDE